MKVCKFCGITEETTHINRDSLCARCYRVLEKVRQGRSTHEELEWHDEMCEFNIKHGMFVPVAMRRKLAHLKPTPTWSCKNCGKSSITNRDFNYTNYCTACADDIRRSRIIPKGANRKQRSDKGSKRSPVTFTTKPDKRIGPRTKDN